MMQWLPAIFIIPYIILLLRIYRSLKRAKPFTFFSAPHVPVSVIIPCRNEERSLTALLTDISFQDYPPALYEVIVIDNNSTDKTFRAASEFKQIKNIKVIHNSGSGKKEAVRCGIDAASSGLIITTDADCRAGEKWISTIVTFYHQHQADLIIAPVKIISGKGFPSKFQELEFMGLQGVTAGTALDGNPTMCNGANLAFTKKIYYKNDGNLHPEIPSGDDIFLLHSVKQQAGSRILWLESPEATINTAPVTSTSAFLKQRSRWLAKSRVYKDSATILLGTVTLIPSLLILFALAASFFNSIFIPLFAVLFLVKSIPDFLILKNTTSRYGNAKLMKWFVPAQLFYPFYVTGVAVITLLKGRYR